jgi:hypothetical protein
MSEIEICWHHMRLIFLNIGYHGIVEVTGSIPVGSTN